MLRRDYLLRMIDEMGRIVARIRERLLGGDTAAVEIELQAAARVAGIELQAARALTVDSLLVLLSPTPATDPGRVKIVAQILELDAERARAAGDEAAAEHAFAKAQRLRDAVRSVPQQ